MDTFIHDVLLIHDVLSEGVRVCVYVCMCREHMKYMPSPYERYSKALPFNCKKSICIRTTTTTTTTNTTTTIARLTTAPCD